MRYTIVTQKNGRHVVSSCFGKGMNIYGNGLIKIIIINHRGRVKEVIVGRMKDGLMEEIYE